MHIYLIGYRGSGKTTVGRLLATQLGKPSIDCDDLIEKAAGQTIREIFAAEGERGFRDREQAIVEELALRAEVQPAVIALGGGAVLREANRAAICRSGHRVWLTAAAPTLAARIQGDQSTAARRPALSALSGYDEIVKLLAEREPLYAAVAQKTLNTEGLSAEAICEDIADWLKKIEPAGLPPVRPIG